MNIINGDCLEVLKTLPDKSIDLFICDLPYGCLTGGGGQEKKKRRDDIKRADFPDRPNVRTEGVIAGCAWDIKLDLNLLWIQIKRLCKDDHTPVLMFCNTKFGYDLIKSNESWFRYDLVWNKMRGVSFLSANKMPMKSHEMVYVFSKKGASYYRKDIEGDFPKSLVSKKVMTRKDILGNQIPKILTDNTGRRCVLSVIDNINKYSNSRVHKPHPTEKPVELYKWLIERYSKKGDTVLDPTFGSGNSGRASAELERKYVGIEKDEVFFKKYADSI